MSDKEIKKAHIQEIEIEIEQQQASQRREGAPVAPKRKLTRKKTLFQSAVEGVKETMLVGLDAINGYKEEIVAKKEDKPASVKPNSAFIANEKKEKKSPQSAMEIEFAKKQVTSSDSQYKMPRPAKSKAREEKPATRQSKIKRNRSSLSKNRPSASMSARAESLVELFESKVDKKTLLSDKDFRRFVAMATTLLVLFGLVWYGFTYMTTEDMSKVSIVLTNEFPGPIRPSDLFSSRTPDLGDLLGEPQASGSIDGTQNGFMEYDDKWFGSNSITKLVYGVDKRIYSLDINYKTASMEAVYAEMVKYLGEPIINNLEIKESTWYVDSSMYILTEEEGKAVLNIQTPLYDNANSYPIGQGAIIIQKQGLHDLTGDGQKDVVVIIGEKESYFYKEFSKLHITIWDGENVLYAAFPAETDGGSNPKIIYEDIDKDGVIDVSIQTKNNAVNNYNTFAVKNKEIVSIYASHEKSK